MLENVDILVNLEVMPLHMGDKFRVKDENMQRLEGNIIRYVNGDSNIIIQLKYFRYTKMNVELI